MKYIILITLILLFIGCDMMQDNFNYDKIGDGYELYYSDEWSELETYEDAMRWVYDNIVYTIEEGDNDVWQSPKTTMSLRTGDCEDMAILFINILKIRFGVEASLITYDISRSVVNGGDQNHAIVEYDGVFYDAQYDAILNNITVGYIYIYRELF